jgi:tripartite-type tricarboxylate transporter receptor subunit TctC
MRFSKKALLVITMLLITSFALSGCAPKAPAPAAPAEKPADGWNVERPEGVPADFPNKEIQWIYAFGPGSPMDAYFRMMADKIKTNEGWSKGFIVTYKEGASGRIGWNAFAEAKPDGYTLGFAPSAMLISAVSEEVSYGHDKMSFIINTMSDPGAIGVAPDSKYKTLTELVDAAKASPGTITIGVTSTIGQEGLTVQMIEKQTGAKFNMVAFDGEAEIFAGIMGGHLDAFCLNVSDGTTLIEEGKIVILATGDEKRSVFLPDVPTYKEAGYEVTQLNMRSIGGPKDMPEPIRQYLENCFIAAANDPEIKAKVAEMKIPVETLPGAEVEAKFTKIAEAYEALYKENPWN